MIDQNPEGGSHLTEIPFPTATTNKYRPNGNYVRVAYTRENAKGGIIMPLQAKPMDFVLVMVLDIGLDIKLVKKGDRCLVAMKGLINGEQGVMIDGEQTWWTQENLIVTVVEPALASEPGPH